MNIKFMLIFCLWSSVTFGAEAKKKSEIKLEDLIAAYENLVKVKERDSLLKKISDLSLEIDDRLFDDNTIGTESTLSGDEKIYSLSFSSKVKIGFSSKAANETNRSLLHSEHLEFDIGLSRDKAVVTKTFSKLIYLHDKFHAQKNIIEKMKPLIANAQKARENGGVESIASIKWKILYENYSASFELITFAFTSHVEKLNSVLGTKYLTTPSEVTFVRPQWEPNGKSPIESKSIALIESKIRHKEAEKRQEDFFNFELNAQVEVNPDLDEKTYLVGISVPISENNKRNLEKYKVATRIALLKQDLEQAKQNFAFFTKEYTAERKILSKERDIITKLQIKSKELYETTQAGYAKGLNGFGEVVEAFDSHVETKFSLIAIDQQIRNHDIEYLAQVGGL